MTKSVILTIEVDNTVVAPAGQTFDHIAITLTDSAGVSQTARIDGITTLSAQVDNVAAGTVTFVAQGMDTANAVMGAAVSGTDTVVDDPAVTFPQVISISMAPVGPAALAAASKV